ncbi:MAG TPA: helix-turn-helix transcriptional regulator [Symbiobacteriaceae bacterium]|nr:helix-turn-helix transcriptional regulator [Symbiobacteriaceae bacterium]
MPRPLLRRVRNRIAAMRQARGWSQAELALRLGVPRGTVAGWEVDQYLPPRALVGKMAQLLHCRPGDLFPYDFV